MKIAHQETQESYGYIRLTKHLQSQGIKISQHAIRCIKNLTTCTVNVISVLKER